MSKTKDKIIALSRIKPKSKEELDSLQRGHQFVDGHRKCLEVLRQAEAYWLGMSEFRRRRERNKRYTYGDQWRDDIVVDGRSMSEEEYIISQGNIPLKNNLIRRLVNQVVGTFRAQSKEPVCVARDREEQSLGETMSVVLQYNMQMNRHEDLLARSMEEFLISGLIVHSKRYGWRNDRMDCWTDYVNPNCVFIDSHMKDFRGWDLSCIGEIHDISWQELLSSFVRSREDYAYLNDIYRLASNRGYVSSYLSEHFGMEHSDRYLSFYVPQSPDMCRVIEVWRKETKPRYRCHDYQRGHYYKIDESHYDSLVKKVNEQRLEQGISQGLSTEEIPLIEAEWFVDSYWCYYFLSPFGDVLSYGESPYKHKSHPYVFKAYPFIDGEIHSFVENVIDQQRYVNRLITLYDWIMRSSAKGVLLFPEDALPDDMSLEEVADEWTRFNGVIAIKSKPGHPLPQQISSNSTNVGISELLNLQLKLFEDVSGIHGALQGKPGTSGMSAALYSQQTQNATTSLLDMLDSFASFVRDGAYKDIKNIQQYYDKRRILNIAGRKAEKVAYEPDRIQEVEFDLSIAESTNTPVYRQIANDFLMQIWQAQQISLEQLLEHGDFPFADELLASIKAQSEQLSQQDTQGEAHTPEHLPVAEA